MEIDMFNPYEAYNLLEQTCFIQIMKIRAQFLLGSVLEGESYGDVTSRAQTNLF